MREPVGAAERVDILALHAGGREPVRPLPAEALAPHRPGPVQPFPGRRGLGGPGGRPLLDREVVDEAVLVGLLVLDPREALGAQADAPRADADSVPRRRAGTAPIGRRPPPPPGGP